MAARDGTLANEADSYRDPPPFLWEGHDHRLEFYPAGKDRLDALLALIAGAKHSLKLFYYLFMDDEQGRKVRDALVAAAERGVAVQLIVDAFGSLENQNLEKPLREAGAEFAFFQSRWNVRYLIRNHQKMAIADGEIALVGGFNISDHYFAPPDANGWNDLGVSVEGPCVAQLVSWFDQLADWARDPKAQFLSIRRMVREWEPGEGPLQWLVGGPTQIPSTWARRVRADIGKGRRLDLAMAYFSPWPGLQHAIHRLVRRGKARLIMAGKSDNTTTIAAARSLYRKLLRYGVEIAEFLPCKMHTKLVVIDDVSYVGSANFDMRSLRLNLELMLRIEDAGLAARLREYIDGLEVASRPVDLDWIRANSSWLRRLHWRFCFFLVSVLDYTVSRKLNLGPRS